jgi:hypothetical protein
MIIIVYRHRLRPGLLMPLDDILLAVIFLGFGLSVLVVSAEFLSWRLRLDQNVQRRSGGPPYASCADPQTTKTTRHTASANFTT